jgi:hypothetical protein
MIAMILNGTMQRLLIAVESCWKDRNANCHEAIRRSWGQIAVDLGIDVRFFIGGDKPNNLAADEIWLDVPDDYYSLPHKTQAVAKWFLDHDYTHLFKADTDTFIVPDRLLTSGFEQFDYYGSSVDSTYYHGGIGYFINRKSAEILSVSPVGSETAEDRWVGHALDGKVSKADAGDKLHRYASWHFPVGPWYGNKRYHPDSKWQETMSLAHMGTEGLDAHNPRGLCFQDRAENGIADGEYKALVHFPGHPDRVAVLSKRDLDWYRASNLLVRILSPQW